MRSIDEQVVEFGWPAELAMPLERLCSLCRLLDAWLRSHPQNVCMLHALDGRGRLGLLVLAYRIYCSLSAAGCASTEYRSASNALSSPVLRLPRAWAMHPPALSLQS